MMKRLRAETREQHEALEATLPLGSARMTVAEYAGLVERFLGFYQAWEAKATAEAPGHLQALVAARRKLPLLQADLEALKPGARAALPILDPNWLPAMASEASLLGSMYVVEGSTLGGQIIARQLERDLHFAAGHGYSFFLSYGKAVGQHWKEFGAIVDAMPETEAPAVVDAAQQTFTAFGRWFAAHTEGAGA